MLAGGRRGAGAVNVNSGGALGGTGSVAGAVTVAAGGKLSPGASAGTLTLTGNADISGAVAATNSQSMLFELGSTSDKIVLSAGTLTIGSGLLEFDDFAFTAVSGFAAGDYTLFDTTQSISGSLGSNLTCRPRCPALMNT